MKRDNSSSGGEQEGGTIAKPAKLSEMEQARLDHVIEMVQAGDGDGAAALYGALSPEGKIEYWCSSAIYLERELFQLRESGLFHTEEAQRIAQNVDRMSPGTRERLAEALGAVQAPALPGVVLQSEKA